MATTGPTETVLRQVRAVRRRQNLHVAQHALALWTAAAATAATVMVLAALRGGRLGFALAALAGIVTLCATTFLLVRRVRRRWWGASEAPARIDTACALRGGLTSVVELGGRGHGDLFALLLRRNLEALPRWRPETVVPEVVPARPFAAAVVALGALALVVVFAPALRPPPKRVVVGDHAMDFVATRRTTEGADQLLVAPGNEQQPGPGGAGAAGEGRDEPQDASALAGASASLQDWLQRALGAEEHWEGGEEIPRTAAKDGERVPQRERRPGPAPVAGDRAASGKGEPTDADGRDARGTGGAPGEDGAGGGGAGAGSDTDPALYGEPHDAPAAGADRFELAIAARVRTRRGTMAAWNDAPGAERDHHPALAGQRGVEQPGHRMPVPPAFAPLVRRLFAHAATSSAAHEESP